MNNTDLVIDATYPSPNYNQRISHLVLHYTALNLEDSLKVLTDPQIQVSSHYLIPETYIYGERKVFQLVQENKRAWHAGIGSWGRCTDINDTSIGIEIVNLGYRYNAGRLTWYPFSEYQIQTVIELAKDIIGRYGIRPVNVIGHSDIALGRKVDPGPLFPWKTLYDNGVGAWFNEQALEITENQEIDIQRLQNNLKTYGYHIDVTGNLDQQTRDALKAFKMHFNPSYYSGDPDVKTVAILENLVHKYFPDQVQAMNEEAQESRGQPSFFRPFL